MTRRIAAFFLLALTFLTQTLGYAQTSGLPAPSLPALTSAQAITLFGSLTGCGTGGDLFQGSTGTCVAPGGSMTWPAGAGIAVYAGSSAWGTSLTAPAGTIVGTTDTQTLTNKSIASTEITGLPTFPSGTIVGTTDTQTLTNKSLAGSEVNSGNIAPSINASSEAPGSSTTPTFSTSTRYSTIVVTASITTFTLASGSNGQEKTLTFCENATGGFTVTPPANVHGFMTVGTTLSKCSSQHFNYDSAQTAWLSDGPGVINE